MKKSYKVKFTDMERGEYVFEFLTEDIEKAILEYGRNKSIISYEILKEEDRIHPKSLLLG